MNMAQGGEHPLDFMVHDFALCYDDFHISFY